MSPWIQPSVFLSCVVLAGLLACAPDRPNGAAEAGIASQGSASDLGDDAGSSGTPSSETGGGSGGSTPRTTASASSTTDSASSVGTAEGPKFDLPGAGSSGASVSSGNDLEDGGDGIECVPSSNTGKEDVSCEDGLDDDCDGKPDCQDADCIYAEKCLGCFPIGTEVCYAGFDDDCNGFADCADSVCKDAPDCQCLEVCVPGKQRWCDGPPRCSWGKSTCTPQGTWGPCLEVGDERPPGCGYTIGMKYNVLCCYNSPDTCCQDYPWTKSIGECEGIAECTAPPDDDPTSSTTDGMPPDDEPTASTTTSTSTTTGPPDR